MAEATDWGTGRLHAITDLSPDIRLFEIEGPQGFGAGSPGSHVSLLLPIGGRSEVRSYSVIPGAPAGSCRIAVKRLPDSRGGSAYMWQLAPGARLTLSGPRNHFPLGREAPAVLLVAGGIGITPIYGMALALAASGTPVRLVYAVRGLADAAFGEALAAVLGDRMTLAVGAHPDLPAAIAALPPGGEMYVCGPIGMLEAAKRAWWDSGRPPAGLRFETFGNSGRHAAEAFTVHLPRLGLHLEVPRTATLLETLEGAGVPMIHFCRRGECGLCVLPILAAEGAIDHRDVFFTDEEKAEGGRLCTCVSRVAGGSITLDTGDRLG